MSIDVKWANLSIADDIVPTKKSQFQPPTGLEELVFMARLFEMTEKFDEMVICMRKLVKLNPTLSVEDRNLLSIAYKNVLTPRRDAARVLADLARSTNDPEATALIANLKGQVIGEACALCDEVIGLLETYLIPSAQGEGKVYYLKMKGDYHRYEAEILDGHAAHKDSALTAYQKASEIANSSLPSTNSTRLGLALNFSVFLYEIMHQREEGFALARAAYNEAVEAESQFQGIEGDAQQDFLRLLRENLNLWSTQSE